MGYFRRIQGTFYVIVDFVSLLVVLSQAVKMES